MLQLLSTLPGLPVIVEGTGQVAGTLQGWVLDPDTGKVGAYRLKDGRYLSPNDIRSYHPEGLLVGDENTPQPLEELVRIKELVGSAPNIMKLPVVTEPGERLGKVHDVAVETTGHFLAKLYVRPSLLGRLFTEERIFSREHIIRITSQQIVVRYDKDVPAPGVEPEVAP